MRYIALLRGVFPVNAPNVKLIALFEELGLADLQTIGSSGNVLFTASERDGAKLEVGIEQALYSLLGKNALAVVLSAAQVKSLVESAPFGERVHAPTTYLAVTFFKHALADTASNPNAVYYDPSTNALCTVNDNTAKPHFMTRLEHEYGKENTTRTWSVVLKIANRLDV